MQPAAAAAAASYLSVNNIEVIYDHVILVLKGVSLEVPEGSIVALLGANGAGFKQVTPFMAGDRAMVRKMVEETAGKYAAEKKITPRDCAKEG